MMKDSIEIGAVARPQGIRGALKIRLFADSFRSVEKITRVSVDGKEYEVESILPAGNPASNTLQPLKKKLKIKKEKKKKSPRLSHLPKHTVPSKVSERASVMYGMKRASPLGAFSRFEMQTGLSSKWTTAVFPRAEPVLFLEAETPLSCLTTCMLHRTWSSPTPHQEHKTDLSPTENPEERLRKTAVSVG